MRHRQLKALSLWIVPLLIARAMIPTGFMLSVSTDGLVLTFCSGTLSPSTDRQHLAAQQHASHSDHHNAAGGSDESVDDASCPFSLVASAVTCDVPQLRSAAVIPDDEVADFTSAPTFRVGPVRADRIRGPPSAS